MLNTFLFFFVTVLPKILLSLLIGFGMLFLSMDVFILTCPERALDLVFIFIDLIVFISTFGSCSSLEELNEREKKEGRDEIDPFDFL
ncbi:MAG: hypothetical protein II567_01460 [Candidatus Riflebacteria bacterium]|jgi:hypothetical protein|nr:hypothetical protein [Candidatus Riflebacteria bacterium]MBR4569313.1 hypothetical protein [Candidatus Riflebacteria bacterium]